MTASPLADRHRYAEYVSVLIVAVECNVGVWCLCRIRVTKTTFWAQATTRRRATHLPTSHTTTRRATWHLWCSCSWTCGRERWCKSGASSGSATSSTTRTTRPAARTLSCSSTSWPLPLRSVGSPRQSVFIDNASWLTVGNESAPIQLEQCRFPGLAISKCWNVSMCFPNKIYRSNFIK